MRAEQRKINQNPSVKFTKPAIKVTYFKSLDAAADFVLSADRHRGAFIAMNAEKMVRLYHNPNLFSKIRNPIYYPDGSSMLWFLPARASVIPGCELWLYVLKRAETCGARVLVIGANPNVSRDSNDQIAKIVPNLMYACIDGFRPEKEYFQVIGEMKPDVVFVAMGSPRQEELIERLQVRWPDYFYMGLGGSLDVLTGNVKRAPQIYRRFGFEFLYRILKDPLRAGRVRYIIIFIYLFLLGKFTEHRT